MFIIKHKTRRKTGRAHGKNAPFYFVLYGADGEAAYSDENVNEIAEALNDALKASYSLAPKAPSLWDVYKRVRSGAYQSI